GSTSTQTTRARNRWIRVLAIVLLGFLIAASPVHRNHGGCVPLPRSVHVASASWDHGTELPDGPVSWDINFSRGQGAGRSEGSFVDPATGELRPPFITWAGDLASSL